MRNRITRVSFSLMLLSTTNLLFAQNDSTSGSNLLMYTMIGVVGIVLLSFLLQVADSLLAVEAKQTGSDRTGVNLSLFPKWGEIFKPSIDAPVPMEEVKVLTKGHDILLQGEAEPIIEQGNVKTFAIQPPNFIGISPIPKVVLEVGDEVKAGDVLFFDKKVPDVKYVAPVSGEVIAINRGAKRSIAEVIILADKEVQFREIADFDYENASREDLVTFLMDHGAWPLINQRPFDVVPGATDLPRDIFISTFDTAPLAPDTNLIINQEGNATAFQEGIKVLNQLTTGQVHLGLNAKGAAPAEAFTTVEGAEKHWFHGKHPAGNVGVQIHHIKPINAGEKVWTLNVQEVITLGKLFSENRFDARRWVALTGAEVAAPKYIETYQGANVGDLLKGNLLDEDKKIRVVSGDVLSGKQISKDGFLNFHDDQITVLEEGDDYELFGWLLPITPRPTVSNTFPNFLFPNLKFKANTNTHGEERAFVVTGQYESVLPMDIYPQHLMKSILMNDFERMEGLGIYELSEEDVALCEFVCTSKQPLQQLLREGLDTMREQA